MTRSLRHLLWTLALLLVASAATGAVPDRMSYAGQLDDNGAPANLSATMLFQLYDDEAAGTALWSEAHGTVQVTDGYFTVELGESVSLAGVFDGSPLYLQVTINGQPMLPRTAISSVPYAMVAGEVPFDNAGSGLSATEVTSAISELSTRLAAVEATNASQQTQINANQNAITALAADIGDFVTSTELATTLSNYVTSANLATTLAGYVTTTALSSYVTFTDLTSALANYATTAVTSALDARLTTAEGNIAGLGASVAAVEDKTAAMTADADNVYFTGVNVHVRNGLGWTDSVNARGNLIVGYDEARLDDSNKTGSHNLVVGSEQNYPSYGGLLAGLRNTASAPYASVSGGQNNTASGWYSSVSGGSQNTASGAEASVSGGIANVAENTRSSVSGGRWNVASNIGSSVSGGDQNTASGPFSSVSGGARNEASGDSSSVSGGAENTASGGESSVSGGIQNAAIGGDSSVSGGYDGTAQSSYSSVSGGAFNSALGVASSVSGGAQRSAAVDYGWVAAELSIAGSDAVFEGVNVHVRNGLGGTDSVNARGNLIVGYDEARTTGSDKTGSHNLVVGWQHNYSSYGGLVAGSQNTVSAPFGSVSGGQNNTASAWVSSVSGGYTNTASGGWSSVSGGSSRSVSGFDDWRAGSLFQDL
jgi:hypothetical protein